MGLCVSYVLRLPSLVEYSISDWDLRRAQKEIITFLNIFSVRRHLWLRSLSKGDATWDSLLCVCSLSCVMINLLRRPSSLVWDKFLFCHLPEANFVTKWNHDLNLYNVTMIHEWNRSRNEENVLTISPLVNNALQSIPIILTHSLSLSRCNMQGRSLTNRNFSVPQTIWKWSNRLHSKPATLCY